MTQTINNEAELKALLVSLMVKATEDTNSANQTFEEQATYKLRLKFRQQDSQPGVLDLEDSYPKTYTLTARVNACGSSTPISLDKYIEDFHFSDTHSSTIDATKEVITTHNSTTMRCQIYIYT